MTQNIEHSRRLVIKMGSALLVDAERGTIHYERLLGLAKDIAALRSKGTEVMIVTSGAIAVGRRYLGFPKGALRLEEKQAAAACGQIRLAHAYQQALERHEITVAQVLLTIDDTENRRRYLNARNTINTLLLAGAVPVINENDTVATAEIRFGDNDRLAARVAAMMSADTLLLLSNIDGMYNADPASHDNAELIPVVKSITPEIEALAGSTTSADSSGGMVTKLVAARIAMAAGCHMIIARGDVDEPVSALQSGGRCTWFISRATPRAARRVPARPTASRRPSAAQAQLAPGAGAREGGHHDHRGGAARRAGVAEIDIEKSNHSPHFRFVS